MPNAPGTIGDFVWYDIDGDGVQDPGEPGLVAGSVDLVVDAGTPGEIVVDTELHGGTTSPNYLFTNVNAGDYTVRYDQATLPAGVVLTTPGEVAVTLPLGGAIDDADFGIRGTQSIGDTVFIDVDENGVQDLSAASLEVGQPGIDVILLLNGVEVLARRRVRGAPTCSRTCCPATTRSPSTRRRSPTRRTRSPPSTRFR